VPPLRLNDLLRSHTDFSDRSPSARTYVLAMNKASYDRLPRELKSVIDSNSGQVAAAMAGAMWDQQAAAVANMVVERGDLIVTLLPEAVARWRKATEPVVDAWRKEIKEQKVDGAKLIAAANALLAKFADEPEPQSLRPQQPQQQQSVSQPPQPPQPQTPASAAAKPANPAPPSSGQPVRSAAKPAPAAPPSAPQPQAMPNQATAPPAPANSPAAPSSSAASASNPPTASAAKPMAAPVGPVSPPVTTTTPAPAPSAAAAPAPAAQPSPAVAPPAASAMPKPVPKTLDIPL
jgi:hypothetical protein